jgi:hypothetical protein
MDGVENRRAVFSRGVKNLEKLCVVVRRKACVWLRRPNQISFRLPPDFHVFIPRVQNPSVWFGNFLVFISCLRARLTRTVWA